MDGLLDEPRPGAPRKLSDEDMEKVITKTLESTPVDATHCLCSIEVVLSLDVSLIILYARMKGSKNSLPLLGRGS
jgi:hypothetical protein